jgi:hypothetical protein
MTQQHRIPYRWRVAMRVGIILAAAFAGGFTGIEVFLWGWYRTH